MKEEMVNRYNPFYLNDFLLVEHPALKDMCNHMSIYYLIRFIGRLCKYVGSLVIDTDWSNFIKQRSNYFDLYNGKIVILSLTENNRNAVFEIKKRLEADNASVIEITTIKDGRYFPVWKSLKISLWHFPALWKEYRRKKGHEHIIVGNYFLEYFLSLGQAIVFKEILSHSRPQYMIMSNDHVAVNRILEYLCEDFEIPSIYIQHASVSDYYPPLHFKYAFLDGMDSLIKYAHNKPIHSKVFLIGALRYEKLKRARKEFSGKHTNQTIGIGINMLDSEIVVQKLCDVISHSFPNHKIKVRAHPNLRKTPFKLKGRNIIYTNASEESILDFLLSIDVLISNDSTIHFDAIEIGCKSYKMTLSEEGFTDQYDYTGRGLVPFVESTDKMISILKKIDQEKLPDKEIIRYFDESYDQLYELELSNIVVGLIQKGGDIKEFSETYGFKTFLTPNNIEYYKISHPQNETE